MPKFVTNEKSLVEVPVLENDPDEEKKLIKDGITVKDISNLKDKIENMIDKKNINVSNILQVTRTGMELVSNITNLNGNKKKKLVIESVNLIIDELPVDENIQALISFVFNSIAPTIIDDLISASKGDFKFKKSKKVFCPCF